MQECVEQTPDLSAGSANSSCGTESKVLIQPALNNTGHTVTQKRKKKPLKNLKQAPELLSTSLRCYFKCDEVFRKDYQLLLHLKLKHR
jgi:hypothetical protein